MGTFATLILPIHDHVISLLLFMCSLISLNNVLYSVFTFHTSIKFIPKYFGFNTIVIIFLQLIVHIFIASINKYDWSLYIDFISHGFLNALSSSSMVLGFLSISCIHYHAIWEKRQFYFIFFKLYATCFFACHIVLARVLYTILSRGSESTFSDLRR